MTASANTGLTSGNGEDFEEIIDRFLDALDEADDVTIGDIQDKVGRRAIGPPLLLASLIALSPIGGIPGVPTVFAAIVIILSTQVLIGKRRLWLPRVIQRRTLDPQKVRASLKKMRRPAAWADRLMRPRLTFLTQGRGIYIWAATCILLALSLPALEVVPFAAASAAGAIAVLALALIANDGLVALLGYALSFGAIYLVATIVGG